MVSKSTVLYCTVLYCTVLYCNVMYRWGEHCGHLLALCRQLWAEAAFTDVTLATDTRSFAAHKLVMLSTHHILFS